VTIRARLLLILALVGGVCTLGGGVLIHGRLDRHAFEELSGELTLHTAQASDLLESRGDHVARAAGALATHPAAMRRVRGGAGERDALAASMHSLAAVAELDALLLLQVDGRVAATQGTPRVAELAAAHEATTSMLQRGTGRWWAQLDGVPAQLAIEPISEGGQRHGLALAVRQLVDLDATLDTTGADLAIVAGDTVLVHTYTGDLEPALADVLTGARSDSPRRVGIRGERSLLTGIDLATHAGSLQPRLQVTIPWLPRNDLGRDLLLQVAFLGIVGIAVACALLLLTVRAITRPLERLVAFARRAAEGDLRPVEHHAAVPEIAVLEDALNDWLRQQQRQLDEGEQDAREQRDREIDRWIQGSLNPATPGEAAHDMAVGSWRHEDAGGDLCEIVETASGTLWIALGDASTRGLRAGMLSTLLSGALRAAVETAPASSPGRLLQAMDDVLLRYTESVGWEQTFVALRLLRLAPDGTLAYAGAHEEMLLLRADDDGAEVLDWRGAFCGLGISGEVDDPDGRARLAHGDTLVLVSDGVLAAADEGGRLFGSERVSRVARDARGQPARVMRDRLMAAWTQWARGPDDDATVVVVRRRSGA
jgi:serine phosphatase RsbU (regulator of sigma subunit)